MKYLFTLSFAIVLFFNSMAQSGIIKFEENRKMTIQMPEGHEHMADMLPNFSKAVMQLSYTSAESSFVEVTEDQEHTMENETGGGMIKMKIQRSASEGNYYKNLSDNLSVEKKDLMDKYFIIEKEIETPKWKILNEQKEILGYTCMKASVETEKGTTTAWFTPQIPISNGPDKWGGLPGMILELDEEDGKMTYTAIEVEMKDEVAPKRPTEGKKVSEEEFEKIRLKKEKEMEEMYGAKSKNGGVFIIRN